MATDIGSPSGLVCQDNMKEKVGVSHMMEGKICTNQKAVKIYPQLKVSKNISLETFKIYDKKSHTVRIGKAEVNLKLTVESSAKVNSILMYNSSEQCWVHE